MVPLTNMHFKYTVATVRSGPISAVGFIVKSQSPNHSQSETGFFCGELVGFWSGSGRKPSDALHKVISAWYCQPSPIMNFQVV